MLVALERDLNDLHCLVLVDLVHYIGSVALFGFDPGAHRSEKVTFFPVTLSNRRNALLNLGRVEDRVLFQEKGFFKPVFFELLVALKPDG